MSMSTRIVAIVPADEKFQKMLAVRDACDAAEITYPEALRDFFGLRDPAVVAA